MISNLKVALRWYAIRAGEAQDAPRPRAYQSWHNVGVANPGCSRLSGGSLLVETTLIFVTTRSVFDLFERRAACKGAVSQDLLPAKSQPKNW